MEIDVTHMVGDADNMRVLSGSIAELGEDASSFTWGNSLRYGYNHPLLTTDEERQAAREHFADYGAWTDEQIAAWGEAELQGITCQEVASAIREMEIADTYEDYQKLCERGTCSGRLYRGDDGRWFFELGA